MQNIEFKAELRDVETARSQCHALGAQRIGMLRQTDTYFKLSDGRLKRREAPGEPVEWIYYHRTDHLAPRMCNYAILSDDQAARRWGSLSLRQWLIVRKTRELWMLQNVRIHLDEVDDVGTFVEFEAQVDATYGIEDCHLAVEHLKSCFAPLLGEPISGSYSDLMEQVLELGPDGDDPITVD